MPATRFVEYQPLPRREMLAAMVIFILPLISILATNGSNLPQWTDYVLLVLFWGSVLFALGLALIQGLPRWSLSYLGFVLMWGVILSRYDRIWSWIYPYFIQSFGPRSYWSLSIQMLSTILLGALILVNLFRLLPYTRGVWGRMREDWTQLSFMLFGGLVVAILIAFDEYQHESIWKLIAWLWLAVGAWLYLRAKNTKRRILALIGGASGAMLTVALAKWLFIPLQKWPNGYPLSPSETTRWLETGGAIIGWIMILILLMAPISLKLLPEVSRDIASKEQDTIVP